MPAVYRLLRRLGADDHKGSPGLSRETLSAQHRSRLRRLRRSPQRSLHRFQLRLGDHGQPAARMDEAEQRQGHRDLQQDTVAQSAGGCRRPGRSAHSTTRTELVEGFCRPQQASAVVLGTAKERRRLSSGSNCSARMGHPSSSNTSNSCRPGASRYGELDSAETGGAQSSTGPSASNIGLRCRS